MLIKWSKKRTSSVLAGIGYVMVFVILCFTGATAVYILMGLFLDPAPSAIVQEESEPTQTCYFARIKFVGTNQNGAELEVTEIPAECPPEKEPVR